MKNNYRIFNNYAIIEVKSNKYGDFDIYIDSEDIERCKNHKWAINYNKSINNFYCICRRMNDKKIYLHRYIMDFPENKVIDHINRNTLDNRKCNLRICTQKINNTNRSPVNKNNTSGYANIYFYKKYNKYKVAFKHNYKEIFVGYFDKLEDAKKARDNEKIRIYNE